MFRNVHSQNIRLQLPLVAELQHSKVSKLRFGRFRTFSGVQPYLMLLLADSNEILTQYTTWWDVFRVIFIGSASNSFLLIWRFILEPSSKIWPFSNTRYSAGPSRWGMPFTSWYVAACPLHHIKNLDQSNSSFVEISPSKIHEFSQFLHFFILQLYLDIHITAFCAVIDTKLLQSIKDLHLVGTVAVWLPCVASFDYCSHFKIVFFWKIEIFYSSQMRSTKHDLGSKFYADSEYDVYCCKKLMFNAEKAHAFHLRACPRKNATSPM